RAGTSSVVTPTGAADQKTTPVTTSNNFELPQSSNRIHDSSGTNIYTVSKTIVSAPATSEVTAPTFVAPIINAPTLPIPAPPSSDAKLHYHDFVPESNNTSNTAEDSKTTAAPTLAAPAAGEILVKGQRMATNTNDFISSFYQSSRLHHLSTWKL